MSSFDAIRDKLRDPGFTPGKRDVAPMFELLTAADEDEATRVIRALHLVAHARERAAREWNDAKAPLRHRLVALLGRAAGDDAHDALVLALTDEDTRTRKSAARALGRLQNTQIRETAAKALRGALTNETKPEVTRAIVEALGKIGSAQDVEAIGDRTEDASTERVRREAITRITRTETRANPARIAAERELDAPFDVMLECREGLETILASELQDARVIRKGRVLAKTRSLRALSVARTWMTAGIVIHRSDDKVDLAQAIANAAPLLRKLTEGAIRWRVEWVGEGHKRAQTRELAERVHALAPDLVNDPIASDWEIRVAHSTVIAIPKSWDDARFSYRVADVPAASHPTLAAALVRLAGPREDDVVWDPFVGSGLELVERARLGPYRSLLGTDLDEKALESAKKNMQSARIRDVNLVKGDARNHAPRGVTLIITNPPMGRRVQLGKLDDLLGAFIENVARVLMREGRFVWITPRARVTNRMLEDVKLKKQNDLVVDMKGFAGNLQRWTW